MTITRAQAETELVSRCKKKMQLVDMVITVVGVNADLSGPMATALRTCGVTPASPITVTDSDLGDLPDDSIDEFFDRAELRLLENISGNIDLTDIQVGPRRESLSQLSDQLEKLIVQKTEKIANTYGDSSGNLTPGVISLDFAQKYDDTFTYD